MMFENRKKQSVRGFTLIELLVVVAIIALLMAILLPSLGRARDQAKSAACASNLKQIATGMYLYATEYDNFVVPYYTLSTKAGGNAIRSSYAGLLADTGCIKAPSQVGVSGYDPSIRSIGRSVFQCPSGLNEPTILQYNVNNPVSKTDPRGLGFTRRGFEVRTSATTTQIKGNYDTWYSGICSGSGIATRRNAFPFRYFVPDITTGGIAKDGGGNPYGLSRYSQIPSPGQTAMLFDGGSQDVTNTMFNFVNVRHNGWQFANVQFADGHVEPVPPSAMPQGDIKSEVSYEDLTEWRKYPRVKWRIDME